MLAFVTQPILAKKMEDWQLLPRPERVTEFYFARYRQLHASASPGIPQTVAFTVHNLERRTTTYRYTIMAVSEDDKVERSVGRGSFTLVNDQSLTTKKTVTIPVLSDRVAVRTNLEYTGIAYGDTTPSTQKQSIHYWTADTGKKPDKGKKDHEGA